MHNQKEITLPVRPIYGKLVKGKIMNAVTKTIEFEFLKRDFRQVAMGYVVACIGMAIFGIRAAKLESKVSKVEFEKEELENYNEKLQKDVVRYGEESKESLLKASRLSREKDDLSIAIMALREELAKLKD